MLKIAIFRGILSIDTSADKRDGTAVFFQCRSMSERVNALGQTRDNRQTLPHEHMRAFLGESCAFRTAMARTYDADSPVVWIKRTFCEQERRNINGGAQPARKSIIEKRDEIEPLPLPIIELQLCRTVRFIYRPSL